MSMTWAVIEEYLNNREDGPSCLFDFFLENREQLKDVFTKQPVDTFKLITSWANDRNIINGSTAPHQFLKLIEEIGELAGNLARGKPIDDDIGDSMVVLNNLAEMQGYSAGHCLNIAYDDIKNRTGRMINNVFVKEEDLPENNQ